MDRIKRDASVSTPRDLVDAAIEECDRARDLLADLDARLLRAAPIEELAAVVCEAETRLALAARHARDAAHAAGAPRRWAGR
jgi:hypothetical protein